MSLLQCHVFYSKDKSCLFITTFIYIFLSFMFKYVSSQRIFVEGFFLVGLECNPWSSILIAIVVYHIRCYELLSAEQNCRMVRESDHPNFIIGETLQLQDSQD